LYVLFCLTSLLLIFRDPEPWAGCANHHRGSQSPSNFHPILSLFIVGLDGHLKG